MHPVAIAETVVAGFRSRPGQMTTIEARPDCPDNRQVAVSCDLASSSDGEVIGEVEIWIVVSLGIDVEYPGGKVEKLEVTSAVTVGSMPERIQWDRVLGWERQVKCCEWRR